MQRENVASSKSKCVLRKDSNCCRLGVELHTTRGRWSLQWKPKVESGMPLRSGKCHFSTGMFYFSWHMQRICINKMWRRGSFTPSSLPFLKEFPVHFNCIYGGSYSWPFIKSNSHMILDALVREGVESHSKEFCHLRAILWAHLLRHETLKKPGLPRLPTEYVTLPTFIQKTQ